MTTKQAFLRLETTEDYDITPLIGNKWWKQLPKNWRIQSIEYHTDVVLFKVEGPSSDLPSVVGLLRHIQKENGGNGLVYSS